MKYSKSIIKYYNTQMISHLSKNYVCFKIGKRGMARNYQLSKEEFKDAKINENGSK